MNGLTTEQIMKIALDLLGETEVPLDSGIHHRGENIKKIIFTMDANVGLLHMARQLGFDAVVAHHPCGVLLHQGEMYRKHIDIMERHGLSRKSAMDALGALIDRIVESVWNNRFRMLYHESPNKTVLEVDAARLLGLPFMNIHNLFDEQGRRILQTKIDETFEKNPDWKLKDVLGLIQSLPEAHLARDAFGICPVLFLGNPESRAGRTVFVHGALCSPHPDMIHFYWNNGYPTVVVLHTESENLQRLKREARGNLVLTGHFLGDSIGMTPFIRALRGTGVEVVCMGGIIDVDSAPPAGNRGKIRPTPPGRSTP